ncbi:MAG: hypothetical protein R3B72_39135 [Polyangiaceae bacterium]
MALAAMTALLLGCNLVIGFDQLEPTATRGSGAGVGGSGGAGSGGGYLVGGTVSGAAGTLVLQSAGEELELAGDGPFTFSKRVSDGSAYQVAVVGQPSGRHCMALDAAGIVEGADVMDVAVRCLRDRPTYFKPWNTGSGDRFGFSVAFDGATLVVGANGERSAAASSPGDDSLDLAGAAYVFVQDGAGWKQEGYLKAPSPAAGDQFGIDVDVDGDRLVVGAWREGLDDRGAAYVFARVAGVWSLEQRLEASDAATGDHFGFRVAIEADTVVVGAPERSVGALAAGGAYVFAWGGSQWVETDRLEAPTPQAQARFGFGVSLSQDRVAIGAPGALLGPGVDAGIVHLFEAGGGGWARKQSLEPPHLTAGDGFGSAVALDGSRLVVGAPGEDSAAVGVDGDPMGDGRADSGAAYLFEATSGDFELRSYLKASNPGISDKFGRAVALHGDDVMVGAFAEGSFDAGVGGDGEDDSGFEVGAAYAFRLGASGWQALAFLKAHNPDSGDWFGRSVAVHDGRFVAGGPQESSAEVGLAAAGDDDDAPDAGAVYLFE